ncbi:thiol-disulfide oxidoreductase ResA [Aquibacillus albus]|uniref:Peroxiredoxin n=1 Tax=Aquibacillus albus TaxID=1168171 RepID=A0ABS2MVH1_9BACI|nr:thiol-disulfide oxidoreductase ResA [Aquibacillus albus]MBM7569783.1 peroxiredoxin [Aquibacillus albus]
MGKIEEARVRKSQKKKIRLLFRSILLFIMFSALIFALVSNFNKDKAVIGVSDVAPNFVLHQMNGKEETLELSGLEGKGVMLNFWATYCKPCEEEMPYMESLYPEYSEKGVEIVAVSVDATKLVIDRFIDKYELSFPVLHDNNGQVMDAYNIGPLPTTFFINSEGKVVEKIEGALTLNRLESYLQQIQPDE